MADSSFQNEIVIPALDLIRNDSRVKRFYFIPGLFSIIFLGVLLVYQSVYTYVVILWKQEKALEIFLNFFHSQYVVEIIVTVVIFLILHFALTPVFEWGLIRYINEKTLGKKVYGSDSIGFWVFRFYPMFEYNNLFGMFKFTSLVNAFLFAIRFLGTDYLSYMFWWFTIAFIFSSIINVVLAYTKYEIVLENKWVFEAIGVSSQISLVNLKTTIRLYLMMFFVNVRVILNFILFLIFPLIFIAAITYITSTIFLIIAIAIIAVVFIGLVLTLGYMTTVLEVFKTSAWYFAYRQGREKLDIAQAESK